jgi:hypothetical protein
VSLTGQSKPVARPILTRAVLTALACAAALSAFTVRAADPPEKVFDLRIAGGSLPVAQRVIRVTRGERVRWRISSDAPGELHVHAYHLEVNVLAGQPAELAFRAFATGRYRVEWHPVAGTPVTPGAHHAPPLAMFEVHPR